MSIITKKGDQGYTFLFDGTKVLKSDRQPKTYGTIDELSAILAITRAKLKNNNKFIFFENKDKLQSSNNYFQILLSDEGKIYLDALIKFVQERLVYLMCELAVKRVNVEKFCKVRISKQDIEFLEILSYKLEEKIGQLKSFIISGSNEIEAYLNFARTIARRAEREIVDIKEILREDSQILPFINRLSDLLFLLSVYYYENN